MTIKTFSEQLIKINKERPSQLENILKTAHEIYDVLPSLKGLYGNEYITQMQNKHDYVVKEVMKTYKQK